MEPINKQCGFMPRNERKIKWQMLIRTAIIKHGKTGGTKMNIDSVTRDGAFAKLDAIKTKCLQCGKSATVAENVNGYEIRQCSDGHRTGQLTAEQTAEIMAKMSIDLDANGEAVFAPVKKSKRAAVKRAA
jgi:hypothetical protein